MPPFLRKLSPLTLPPLLRPFSTHPSPPLCHGCGTHFQSSNPSLPGFFSLPSAKTLTYHSPLSPLPLSHSNTSLLLKSGLLQQLTELDRNQPLSNPKPLICARCHSLRHYGRVKTPSAETLLPDFDFDSLILPKILSSAGSRSVALLVIDAADFDGSFPRKIGGILSRSFERGAMLWKENKPGNVARIVVAVTKVDLLHSVVPAGGLEGWARRRAGALGVGRVGALHVVSAARGAGVGGLVERVAGFAGERGSVWVVGAQNAGKSTLINAMGRCGGAAAEELTEAAVPGTTLGIVRVEGVLPGQAKMFDTPGILHAYQITTRLSREEQKLVHVSKELRPRTYRIKAGHSVHVGGLMRLDVEESSADSIYLTVWASSLLPLHMGKIENSQKMIEDHFGRQLQPPIGANRIAELGKWVRTEFRVTGDSWEESSTDITTAGLGWIAVCLKGEAVLGAWTYDGIDVASRSSMITVRAKIFEEAGFSASKIVSKADSVFSREKHDKSDKKRSLQKMKVGSSAIVDI